MIAPPHRDGPSLASQPEVVAVFQSALARVLEVTQAQRCVILFGEETEEPKVRASRGVAADNFWLAAPVSLSLLRKVRTTGEGIAMLDPGQNTRLNNDLSLVIHGIKAVVCAPIWSSRGKVAGAIYADWTDAPGALAPKLLPRIQEIALSLEGYLRAAEAGESPENPFGRRGTLSGTVLKPLAARLDAPAPFSRVKKRLVAPHPRERAIFFRQLAALFGAGVTLAAALATLARQPSDKATGRVCEELSRRVERGQSFAAACQELEVFPDLAVGMLKMGERSGQLQLCLERLAALEEDAQIRRAHLTSSLIYPAFVLAGSAVFLAVAPAAMVKTQVETMRQAHVALPWFTKALIAFYAVVGHPLVWILAAAALVAFFRLPALRARAGRLALRALTRTGPLERVWESYQLSHWSQSLATGISSGLTLPESLTLAASATSEPSLRTRTLQICADLEEGRELPASLRSLQFPRMVCEMVRSGQESGRLPEMLLWISQHCDADFRGRVQTLLALLEPAIMTGLGILAAMLMIATLLPMSEALQAL